MVNISFAWDDGSTEDLKMMDLLMVYNIPAIFFVPVTNSERSVISNSDVKTISGSGFEIGAHTYSHSYLTYLPITKAEVELTSGKEYYEQLLGKEIKHFCFPGGKYNNQLVAIAKNYFTTARTADTGSTIKENSFLIKPAFHFFERGKKSLILNSLKHASILGLLTIKNIFCPGYFDYLKHIIEDLDKYPSLHKIIIWGHSWEIEEYNLWGQLESLFRWINESHSINVRNYSDLLIEKSFHSDSKTV